MAQFGPISHFTTNRGEYHIMVMTEKFFDYILSYSPINNIKDGSVYPACLITGGLHDPRVQVSELLHFTLCLHFIAERLLVLFPTNNLETNAVLGASKV